MANREVTIRMQQPLTRERLVDEAGALGRLGAPNYADVQASQGVDNAIVDFIARWDDALEELDEEVPA